MNVPINITWPTSLSLPLLDYNGAVRDTMIVSPIESAAIKRRSRFTRVYPSLSVVWVMKMKEYKDFGSFFLHDLGNGAAQFKISLLFPLNSGLTDWIARFDEKGYEAEYMDGSWRVSGSLELVMLAVLPEAAPLFGWGSFLVRGEESGTEQEFETIDGFIFYVKSL